MRDDAPFVINKSSKLYRFFQWNSTFWLTRFIVQERGYNGLNVFRDMCSFLKISALLLLWYILILFSVFTPVYKLVNDLPLVSLNYKYETGFILLDIFCYSTSFFVIVFLFLFLFLIYVAVTVKVATWVINKIMSYFRKVFPKKEVQEEKQPMLLIQALKDKSSKICRGFDVK